MKKLFFVMCACAMMFIACDKKEAPVKAIENDSTKVEVTTDSVVTDSVAPENAEAPAVEAPAEADTVAK